MGIKREMILAIVLCLATFIVPSEAQLRLGFYVTSCPLAEAIVKAEAIKGIARDRGTAAGLLRMHFHDCFVRGCDGSVLIDSTSSNTAEKDSPPNNPSLRGFEVIDNAKTRIEAVCPGVVSCADILAFAARDSVALTGGLTYAVPAGRRDGTISLSSEALTNLPGPDSNVAQLTADFKAKGLSQSEMVTLSGAHTLGRSHCSSFTSRLYSFNSTVSQDPSLDPTYAAQLKQLCPQGSTDASLVAPMDPPTPNLFDSNYYLNIIRNRGLFTSDQVLISDPSTAPIVRQNLVGLLFKARFAAAMVKMGNTEVKTGTNGEIRRNCRVIN